VIEAEDEWSEMKKCIAASVSDPKPRVPFDLGSGDA
jgi:hypothetical protein